LNDTVRKYFTYNHISGDIFFPAYQEFNLNLNWEQKTVPSTHFKYRKLP
jgi:hypothetical protein